MPTTTNYGWTTPADTDLVKDGASAIRTLGTAIDTTVFNNAGAAINKTIIDAKGDLIVGSASDTAVRLAVGGTNGHVLTVNSSATNGIEWAAAAGGGMTLLSTTTMSGASTTISNISQSYNTLMVLGYGFTNNTADGYFRVAPNGTTNISSTAGVKGQSVAVQSNLSTYIQVIGSSTSGADRTSSANSFTLIINNYTSTTNHKPISVYSATGGNDNPCNWGGAIRTNTAITSLVFDNSGGNLSAGTVEVWGIK